MHNRIVLSSLKKINWLAEWKGDWTHNIVKQAPQLLGKDLHIQ